MNTMLENPTMPPSMAELVVRRAPLTFLWFDQDLICRYAAPAEDELVVPDAHALIGNHADDVLPAYAAGRLRRIIEHAARHALRWRGAAVAMRDPECNGPDCWRSVVVEPVQERGFHGVLVIVGDATENILEFERLKGEVQSLREAREAQTEALIEFASDLRNALTPVAGYLQVLIQRPWALAGRSWRSVIGGKVLPQVHRAIAITDRLRQPPFARMDPTV